MLTLVQTIRSWGSPRQVIKFSCQTKIGVHSFETDRIYSFKVVKLGNVRWLIYRGERFMTLDSFANQFVDQHWAQWVDKAA